jgi:hypothetical protein
MCLGLSYHLRSLLLLGYFTFLFRLESGLSGYLELSRVLFRVLRIWRIYLD